MRTTSQEGLSLSKSGQVGLHSNASSASSLKSCVASAMSPSSSYLARRPGFLACSQSAQTLFLSLGLFLLAVRSLLLMETGLVFLFTVEIQFGLFCLRWKIGLAFLTCGSAPSRNWMAQFRLWFPQRSGGVRVRFRVRFQAVKVPIFGGFPVENPTKRATASKLF